MAWLKVIFLTANFGSGSQKLMCFTLLYIFSYQFKYGHHRISNLFTQVVKQKLELEIKMKAVNQLFNELDCYNVFFFFKTVYCAQVCSMYVDECTIWVVETQLHYKSNNWCRQSVVMATKTEVGFVGCLTEFHCFLSYFWEVRNAVMLST